MVKENRLYWGAELNYEKPRLKRFLSEIQDGTVPNTWWTYDVAGHNDEAQKETAVLLGKKVFSTPKPLRLIERMLQISVEENDIVLDFFAGSGSTAHAVLKYSTEKKPINFICIQLSEVINEKTEAFKAGYRTIFDITKSRIQKAIKKIEKENPDLNVNLGFKVFETVPDFRINSDENGLSLTNLTMFDDVLLTEEQYQTLLVTWSLYDGSELTTPITPIQLDDYTAHLCERRLYMIAPNFSSNALKALLHKLDNIHDENFDPNKIIFYANNFDSVKQMELNEAIRSYANKKSIEIDVVVRN
ncbi:MAG TPA: hypothetical protein DCR58_01935 [Idiomarina baltica]|uniref:site-specific DNA-methyltransferase (adenine-specific) n=3 Tax=Alteromonadales TaxID=135622 RepID=A0A358DYL6_9ALTE|nr:hypothetical protein [Idiomarina baltica]HBU51369.1 hypothetical protein [Alteromonas australica]|tara:strand:+ start:30062 stop:30967 length:906 start_codon:yes stop_codon:yes gene_type:complete